MAERLQLAEAGWTACRLIDARESGMRAARNLPAVSSCEDEFLEMREAWRRMPAELREDATEDAYLQRMSELHDPEVAAVYAEAFRANNYE